jgi:S1-C subfamily serine protease
MVMREPTGWFGVRISDTAMMDDRGTAFFDAYPVVTHVDPNSPASKAGVKIGDVLLMFNNHDMRGGSIELAQWLKVGAPFVLKIRRNDRTRVLRGTLAKRPADWEQRMVVEMTQQMSMKDRLDLRSGSISREPMNGGVVSVRSRVATPGPLPAVLAPALGYGGAVYPFAGASFTQLNPDLCDVLGVKPEGVFVMNVAEGSAARNAGLRGGDIILRADNVKVTSPIDLVQAIRSADERDRMVDLQILRKHQLQSLTLRW